MSRSSLRVFARRSAAHLRFYNDDIVNIVFAHTHQAERTCSSGVGP
jgi:hypothetical protein